MQRQNTEGPQKDEQQSRPSDLEFVLVKEPTQRTTGADRRRVRSHVTKLQHQRTRERESANRTRVSLPFIPYSNEDAKVQHGSAKSAARKPAKVTKSKINPKGRTAVRDAFSKLADEDPPLDQDVEEIEREEKPAKSSPLSYWRDFATFAGGSLGSAFSKGTMSFRTFALDDSTNTVGMSLEALGLDLPSVLGCYKLIAQIQSQDFENQYCQVALQSDVPIWERFYRFVFSDPVLLTVALLITIRYRLECLGYRNRANDFMQVLQLEEFLIKRVNAALKQPERAISDPMLVAVALCAAYEVKNANPEAYHVHMKGLMRMILMRGGLTELGKHDPYLERLLIWHDVNTSQIIGHQGYLEHMPNSLQTHRPASNLLTFRTPIEAESQKASSDAGSSNPT